MGITKKDETEEQILSALSGYAGNILNMIKAYFDMPKGIDIMNALIFTASLAGHSCHEAVKAEKGSFAVVTLKDGKNFYFGDDVNRYLLEDRLNVVNLCLAIADISEEDVLSIVHSVTRSIGNGNYTICGCKPESLYKHVNLFWEGIFENMTAKYCKSPAEWPILFGIVLQNILRMAIEANFPKNEAGKIAVECAIAVSKMDKDSF